tara:strand:+ start:621 stop:827 length:207 start_codon:yes stop_codon:yes gene_type:complete
MATVIFFIYLHYLRVTGYNVVLFDWICLFVVGLLQAASWFVRIGVLTHPNIGNKEEEKSKRLDDWFKN